MKNKFLNICVGTGILFLSAGFFIRSISTANAAPPSPKEFIEEGKSKIGKYQISMVNSGNSQTAIIIDTETGKTFIYDNSLSEWIKHRNQIPENAVGN
jgi:hypothetical protein